MPKPKKSKQRPLISFVVSVYNLKRYIRDCLDSILSQPFDDYEILLVDNGSTDGGRKICEEYAAKFKQIRYYGLTGEPVLGRAIVHGAHKSLGKYIQFVDVDDMLAENIYDKVAKILKSKKPGVLFGRFLPVFEDKMLNFPDKGYDEKIINNAEKDAKKAKEIALTYLAENQPFILSTWRLIVSRDLCLFLKGVDERTVLQKFFGLFRRKVKEVAISPNLHYDVCSLVYTIVAAWSVRYINAPIYKYRVRASSISRITPTIQVSSCTTAMFDLIKITENITQTKAEKTFAKAYSNQFYFQLASALCTLSDSEVEQAADEIDGFLKTRADLAELKTDYEFLNNLIANGAKVVLKDLQEKSLEIISKNADKIKEKSNEIYLAPTGNVGTYLKTAFENAGIKITAFFDNDDKKSDVQAGGVAIYKPEYVKDLIAQGKSPTIIIGTRYANVCDELSRQFEDLGVKSDHILRVEF